MNEQLRLEGRRGGKTKKLERVSLFRLITSTHGYKSILVKYKAMKFYHSLSPERSLSVINHSPTGFNWGYYGSGPAQTALAILLEFTEDEELSVKLHQKFKEEVIAKIKENDYTLESNVIRVFIKKEEKLWIA